MPTPNPRRRLFPQDRSAYIYQGPMRSLLQAPQMSIVIYSNSAGTTPADIVTSADQAIEDSIVIIAGDGLLPEFYGPVDANTVWARPLGMTVTAYPLYPVIRSEIRALADLPDIADVAPAGGQVLIWDAGLNQYVPGAQSGGGGGGGGTGLQYTQLTPATVWGPIDHNFGYRPAGISLFSSDFVNQYEDFTIQHLSANSLRIAMDIATAGVALIS
jgi:hypothetical protein